jgi:predicted KAP-like P-loop ATPase
MHMNKRTDKIIDFLKENKWTFIISAGIIVFFEPLKDLVNKLLVEPIFSEIEATETLNVLFFAFTGITLIYWIQKIFWRKYKVALKHILIYGIILIAYLINRSHPEIGWSLLNINNSWKIYYMDILILICGLAIFTGIIGMLSNTLLFKYAKKNMSTINLKPNCNWIKYNFPLLKKKSFQELTKRTKDKLEKSIDNKEDKYGFEIDEPLYSIKNIQETDWDTSQKIIDNILNTKLGKGSFVIGLNGEWGSGKTTYWHLMKEKLNEHKDIVIVEFNPWNNECDTSITQNFLNRFKNEVSKYHSNITPEIEKYSKALSQTYKNGILKTLTGFASKNHNSNEDELEKLKDTILKLDKTLIVFIDDIDRLCNDEIYEVLKLVRNNANFPKTFFVLAYDREYIEESLSNLNIPKSMQYLEKIINYEYQLTNIKHELLNKELKKLTSKDLKKNKNHFDIFERDYEEFEQNKDTLFKLIKNYRDIKRLGSTISEKYLRSQNEIIFRDLILAEALRLKHPLIFNALIVNKNQFLIWAREDPFSSSEGNSIDINDILKPTFENIPYNKLKMEEVISYINSFAHSYKSNRNEAYQNERLFMSFFNKESFDLYTQGIKNKDKLSFEEFNDWKCQDDIELDQISQWFESKPKQNIIVNLLTSISNNRNTSKSEFQKCIKTLFYILTNQIYNKLILKVQRNQIYEKTIDKLSINKMSIHNSFIASYLLDEISNQHSYVAFSDLLYLSNKNRNIQFTPEFIKGFILTYIKKFKHFDKHFETIASNINELHNKESQTISLREIISTNLLPQFLNYIISTCYATPTNLESPSYKLKDNAVELCNLFIKGGTSQDNLLDNLKIFLLQIQEPTKFRNELNEFKPFLEMLKSNSLQPISFEFNHLKPPK